jgi:hypothetical protein
MSWLSRNGSDRLFEQQLGEGNALRGGISSGRSTRRSHGRPGARSNRRSNGRPGARSYGRSSARSRRDCSTRTLKRRGPSTADKFKDSAKRVRKGLSDYWDRANNYEFPEYDMASRSEQGQGVVSKEGTATGPGALSAARDGFSNYTPPVYDVSANQQKTDSESEGRTEGSSVGGGSAPSTTPSSVGSQTPPVGSQTPSTSNAPSVAVASAPTTSQDTDTRPTSLDADTRPEAGRKRKVQIPDKYLQPKQLSAFDDFPMEEKIARAKRMYMEAGVSEEDWQAATKEPYGMKTIIGDARAKFKKEEDAERATGSEEKPPEKQPMSK